ncbi:non-muscle caldesmon isoform X1 [Oryzias melastigma]|uniref:Non-muscle caldesmon-like n=1 Tax=Oryzias melastigma TaxID=30732 RepID=A0A3B3CMH7_ORYME|nr:non-muscle caldesmon isoform X1 [Oryzias melastigma]XP_024137947.1 non-muscle caldesmon isoform X1 [Oryzias melastigma]
MSNALLRRNSSKQGLQNLMRLTAQRSIEDAEEVERERRRRAREALHRRNSGSTPGESSPESEVLTEDNRFDTSFKPSSSLEEDEGFSDWTQRRDRQKQQRLLELSVGGQEERRENEDVFSKALPTKTTEIHVASTSRLPRKEEGEILKSRVETEKRMEDDVEERKERKREMLILSRQEVIQRPNIEVEKRLETKDPYTSKTLKHSVFNGHSPTNEVVSHLKRVNRSSSRNVEPEEAEAIQEVEQRLERIRHSLQEKESQELEQLRLKQTEAEQELEELKRRREERQKLRKEEERYREEEEHQRLAKEEEERRRMKEEIEKRRMEAAERMKSLSTSSTDGEEIFSPFTPKASTQKITEKTESLNRSLRKSNSFKKMQPLILMPKIDDKLEQYTSAVENSQEARAVKASLADIPMSPEVVASKKNLFEAGEAWSQSPSKGASCKDAEGLKVGVASLINQWVRSQSDGSSGRPSACRAADVKPGDVMQKKNMWEVMGDSGRQDQRLQGSAAGKKFKFVVTGHGKYEKIPPKDQSGGESNIKSDSYHISC